MLAPVSSSPLNNPPTCIETDRCMHMLKTKKRDNQSLKMYAPRESMILVENVSIIVPDGVSNVLMDDPAFDHVMTSCSITSVRGFGAITLGSPLPKFDSTALHDIVQIPFKIMEVLDEGCKYAIACGLLGMEKANLISRHTSPPWQLPVKLQARTGVVFASSYGQHSKAFEHIYAHAHRVATTEQIEYVRGVLHSHGYPAALLDEIVKSKCDKVTYERKISMELSLRANVQLSLSLSLSRSPKRSLLQWTTMKRTSDSSVRTK